MTSSSALARAQWIICVSMAWCVAMAVIVPRWYLAYGATWTTDDTVRVLLFTLGPHGVALVAIRMRNPNLLASAGLVLGAFALLTAWSFGAVFLPSVGLLLWASMMAMSGMRAG